MPSLLAVLLAAAPLAAAAQEPPPAPPASPPAARPSPAREGVYLGAGLGVVSLGHDSSPSSSGSAVRIRLGAARSPRVLVGFEGGLSRTVDEALSTYDVGLTVFPWKRYGFFRAAVGLTTHTLSESTWLNGHGDVPVTLTEHGGNLLLGTGLALGGTRGLNVTLNAELQLHWLGRHRADGMLPSSDPTTSLALWLGLDWY